MSNKTFTELLDDYKKVIFEYEILLENDGTLIKHIPHEFQNEHLCLMAVEENGLALQILNMD